LSVSFRSSFPFFAPVRSSHLPAVGAGEHTCAHPLFQSDLILTRLNSHPFHIFLFQCTSLYSCTSTAVGLETLFLNGFLLGNNLSEQESSVLAHSPVRARTEPLQLYGCTCYILRYYSCRSSRDPEVTSQLLKRPRERELRADPLACNLSSC
jgi:hypothetical protein